MAEKSMGNCGYICAYRTSIIGAVYTSIYSWIRGPPLYKKNKVLFEPSENGSMEPKYLSLRR